MAVTTTVKGCATFSKSKYFQLEQELCNLLDTSTVNTVLSVLRRVLNFDPNASTYNKEHGAKLMAKRRQQAAEQGVSLYVIAGVKKSYERTRKISECANHLCDSRGYEQYHNFCIRCFAHLYPDEPITRRQKTKESAVIHFIKDGWPDRPWVFDRRVDNGCSRYRPDIFLDLLTHTLIIEVDENQHDSYDCECENKRLMALFQDLGSRPLVLIRFNPDEYIKASGKKMKSCFVYKNQNGLPSVRNAGYWESRLETLRSRIEHHMDTVPHREVTVEHLYYDGFH